jgi:hypothetical protein
VPIRLPWASGKARAEVEVLDVAQMLLTSVKGDAPSVQGLASIDGETTAHAEQATAPSAPAVIEPGPSVELEPPAKPTTSGESSLFDL